jgi:branched-chain amino acid transport system ATP-binding protein
MAQTRVATSDVQLELDAVSSGYGGRPVIENVSLKARGGQVVALLGPNGAGKTTTLMTIAGELTPTSGSLSVNGSELTGPVHSRIRQGLRVITEERSVFMGLSVRDNLRIGHGSIEKALDLFPELRPLMKRRAGVLSGGEQQMLTLARALSGRSQILLVDELSLGLAPLVVARLLNAIREAANSGVAVLLVEQHVRQSLAVADFAYVLRRGHVALAGTTDEIRGRLSEVEDAYLAGAADPAGIDRPSASSANEATEGRL